MEETILTAENLSFSYGRQPVLQHISFSVPTGAYLSIVGPNGSGKTTLLHILCGLKKPDQGQVVYKGKSVSSMGILYRATQFAVVHQNETNVFPFTCREIVEMGLHPHQKRFSPLSKEDRIFIETIMDATQTLDLADRPVSQISGGEFQRVALARGLAQRPKILFLDEATSDMDIHQRIKITSILKELTENKQLTVIAINHDLQNAYQFSDWILALHKGTIYSFGTPKEVMTTGFFQEVFQVKAEMLQEKALYIHNDL